MEAIRSDNAELHEEIEEKPLSLVERIQSTKWQTRKEVYLFLTESLKAGEFIIDQGIESSVYSFVEPWLKNMSTDTNLICQTEGLKTLFCFVSYSPSVSNSTLLLGDELIQKCQFSKPKWGELVTSIIVSLLYKDSESTLLHHILKRFKAKNPKEASFSILCVRQALPKLECSEMSVKKIFKATKTAMLHSLPEVRAAALLLIADFFTFIQEDLPVFIEKLTNLKQAQLKEIKDLIASRPKQNTKWSLGLPVKPDNESLLLMVDNSDNLKQDLCSLIPDGFADAPYINDIKLKRDLLMKFNANIEVPGLILALNDYQQPILTLLHLLETNNSIVYVETFKSLEILIPKIPRSFTYKAKLFVSFLSDKFKEKKKTIHVKVNILLRMFREYEVVSGLTLAEWIVDNIGTHKIAQVKEMSLQWIIDEFHTTSSQVDLLSGEAPKPWFYDIIKQIQHSLPPRLQQINNKEIQSSVKELINKLLKAIDNLGKEEMIMPKKKTEETKIQAKGFYDILEDLPLNYESPAAKASEIEDLLYKKSNIPRIKPSSNLSKKEEKPKNVWEETKIQAKGFYDIPQSNQSPISKVPEQEDELLKKSNIPGINQSSSISVQSVHMSDKSDQLSPITLKTNIEIKNSCLSSLSFASSHISEVQNIRSLLYQNPSQAMNRLLELVESILEVKHMKPGAWRRGIGRVWEDTFLEIDDDTLFSFIRDIIKCLSYSIESMTTALTCLRTVISDESASKALKIIVLEIEEDAFQLLSDWMSHLSLEEVIERVDEILNSSESNSDCAFERFMRWILSQEVELNALTAIIPRIVKALGGIPVSNTINSTEVFGKALKVEQGKELSTEVLRSAADEFLNNLTRMFSLSQVSETVALALNNNYQLTDIYNEWARLRDCPIHYSPRFNFRESDMNYQEDRKQFEICLQEGSQLKDSDKLETFELYENSEKDSYTGSPDKRNSLENKFEDFVDEKEKSEASSRQEMNKGKNMKVYESLIGEEIPVLTFNKEQAHNMFQIYGQEKKDFQSNLRSSKPQQECLIDLDIPYLDIHQRNGLVPQAAHEMKVQDLPNFDTPSSSYIPSFPNTPDVQNVPNFPTTEDIRNYPFNKSTSEETKELISESEFIPVSREKSTHLSERTESIKQLLLKEETEHQKTKKLLEEANKEYLNQVSLNHKLTQQVQSQPPSQRPQAIIEIFQPLIVLPLQSSEAVINFQHLLLHTEDVKQDIGIPLLTAYSKATENKAVFLSGLEEALANKDISNAMSNEAVETVIECTIKFCVHEKLHQSSSEVTEALQNILGILLESKEATIVIGILINLLKNCFPLTFDEIVDESTCIFYRLVLKCTVKLLNAVQSGGLAIRVFDILIELNKLFERYPPEKLRNNCASVNEYENLFRNLRTISDSVISFSPRKSLDFYQFIRASNSKTGIFIKYVEATLQKRYQIIIK